MIPKIIHYCWFGKSKKPNKILNLIDRWKKILVDYKFIEWNEDNFDYNRACIFVKEAYDNKKWAFVTDYVRLYALYNYGGVYLDTDVEVLANFNSFLDNPMFISYESESSLCTAVIGARKNNVIIKEFLNTYNEKKFIKNNGEFDIVPNSELIFSFLKKKDFLIEYNIEMTNDMVHVYPFEYFCAKDIHTYKICKTINTTTIHMLDASWYSPSKKILKKIKKIVMSVINRFRK